MRYLIAISALCLYITLPISIPLYSSLHLTAIIDFPWRLLLCMIFASAWIGAILVEKLKVIKSVKLVIVLLVTIALISQSMPISHTERYWGDKTPTFFALETGDSYGEYAPLTRSTRDSAPFGKRAEFLNGSGYIETVTKKSNVQKYKVVADTDSIIRINTAYFPGWEIGPNCSITKRTLSHIDDSGLIVCPVPAGESVLEIKFVAPPVQRAGNLITLAGIGIYLWILYRSFYPHTTNAKR